MDLNSAPFSHTFSARKNNTFPSKKMRNNCELARSLCFWKPFKHTRKMAKVLSFETIPHFYWKMTRGLSLQMVFSPLFVETLFYAQHPSRRWLLCMRSPWRSCDRSRYSHYPSHVTLRRAHTPEPAPRGTPSIGVEANTLTDRELFPECNSKTTL